jgi:hypothetical protein
MNIVSSITNRILLSPESKLNILWSNTDQTYFTDFIKNLGHNLLSYENLYFYNNFPHLIICNDRFSSYEKIKKISIEYHLPTIIIDHNTKPHWIDDDKIKDIDNFHCAFKIAINANIYKSWKEIHDIIMPYKFNDQINQQEWNTILYNISQRVFSI